MDTLTRDNFWDEQRAKYPIAVKKFTTWIDEYKKDEAWEQLFNGGMHGILPKFHELPLAFQIGVWYQYVADSNKDRDFRDDCIRNIVGYLKISNI